MGCRHFLAVVFFWSATEAIAQTKPPVYKALSSLEQLAKSTTGEEEQNSCCETLLKDVGVRVTLEATILFL